MKLIFKIIFIYLVIILVLNCGYWVLLELKFKPIVDLDKNGFILKIKPLKYAMVFSHGKYLTTSSFDEYNTSNYTFYYSSYHYLRLNNKSVRTLKVLNDLKAEGYEKVWLSSCKTGNSNYISFNQTSGIGYLNETKIPWPDWVSRKEKSGTTFPIFLGFGFIRV